MNDLAHWPDIFREAYALELDKNSTKYAEKWVKFAEEQRLILRKTAKYQNTPENWAEVPLKRLLVGVLRGEVTLQEVADAKGGDAEAFAGLFTSDLRPLGLTFEEAMGMSITHQVALAEVRQHLPADTSLITPEERRHANAIRQEHVPRR